MTLVLGSQFSDPTHHSQIVFRALLDALSRPGRLVTLPALPQSQESLAPSLAAIALALLDHECRLWLDASLSTKQAWRYLGHYTGAMRSSDPLTCDFAFVNALGELPRLNVFNAGSALFPQDSSTVVISLTSLTGGPEILLSGPGIETEATISPAGLPAWFWDDWATNSASYPLGIDIVLVDRERVIGLPRTTKARMHVHSH